MSKKIFKNSAGFVLVADLKTEIIEIYDKNKNLVQLTTVKDLEKELKNV